MTVKETSVDGDFEETKGNMNFVSISERPSRVGGRIIKPSDDVTALANGDGVNTGREFRRTNINLLKVCIPYSLVMKAEDLRLYNLNNRHVHKTMN
jgi:hypothetical protein